jgi:hypothetical protein
MARRKGEEIAAAAAAKACGGGDLQLAEETAVDATGAAR